MAQVKVKGIVISENNMGDFDKMLTILTPNFGKISCVAKGARRPKSALLARNTTILLWRIFNVSGDKYISYKFV